MRVSGGDLCEAEAPTESTDETQSPLTSKAFILFLTKDRLSKSLHYIINRQRALEKEASEGAAFSKAL